MATKIKVFKLVPEESEDITKFLNSVNVKKEGFIINNGNIGVLYSERDDLGRDKNELKVAISEKLTTAQKNYLVGDLDLRSFGAQKLFFEKKRDEANKAFGEANALLAEYEKNWDSELEQKLNDLKSRFGALEKKHKTAGKLDKEEILKSIHELNPEMKATQDAYDAMKAKFEEGKKELQLKAKTLEVEALNYSGEVKQAGINVEQSTNDKTMAELALTEAKKMLADIEADVYKFVIE